MNKRIFWKKIKQRGPIIWSNVDGLMRYEGYLYEIDEDGELTENIVGWMPNTYSFKNIPAYDSFSALRPVGSKKSPYEFEYFKFDEDDGCGDGWYAEEIMHPLIWKTEAEFLKEVQNG